MAEYIDREATKNYGIRLRTMIFAVTANGRRMARKMSYDISFKVKVDGVDAYVNVGDCDANITWNVRKIIELSTGLEWANCENNGLCVDVIPKIKEGLEELQKHPEKYKPYEAKNGWGTVKGTIGFYERILEKWDEFIRWHEELVPVATFWIE